MIFDMDMDDPIPIETNEPVRVRIVTPTNRYMKLQRLKQRKRPQSEKKEDLLPNRLPAFRVPKISQLGRTYAPVQQYDPEGLPKSVTIDDLHKSIYLQSADSEREQIHANELQQMTIEQAARIVHKAYGPDRLYVWMFEIIVVVGIDYGIYDVFKMTTKNVTGSVPTLTFWAVNTVAVSVAFSFLAFSLLTFIRKRAQIVTHDYQSAINAALSQCMAVAVIWGFYGYLCMGKKETVEINEQLNKLLFPVVFPWQDALFVVGCVGISIVIILLIFMSSTATMVGCKNELFLHSSFTMLITSATILIQECANHGYVTCDMRSRPWVQNIGNAYGIWNNFYLVLGLLNASIVAAFAVQILDDLRISKLFGIIIDFPVYNVIGIGSQIATLVVFTLFDGDAMLGKRERIFASASQQKDNRLLHLYFTLSLIGFQAAMIAYRIITNPTPIEIIERYQKKDIKVLHQPESVSTALAFSKEFGWKSD